MDDLMIFGARFVIFLTFILMFVLGLKGGIKEKKSMILVILSIPILILIIKTIHIFYFESRPFVVHQFVPLINSGQDASFPSRHAGVMAAIAFAFFYFKSKWAPIFLFLMLWVGVSRIYVGVHYPLDILGGFVVGIISLVITKQILKRLKSHLFSQSF